MLNFLVKIAIFIGNVYANSCINVYLIFNKLISNSFSKSCFRRGRLKLQLRLRNGRGKNQIFGMGAI